MLASKETVLSISLPIRVAAVALITLSVLPSRGAGQNTQTSLRSSDQDSEKRIVRIVNRHRDLPITLNNNNEAPLFIQDALVKQIAESEHRRLTGVSKDSAEYVSFPTVRLINNSDNRITGFTLFLKNNRTGHTHGFKVWRTVVEPHGDYSISPNEWISPEKLTRVADDGQTTTIKKRVNFDSDKLWLPARAGELALELMEAEFENGAKWSRN